MMPGEVGRVVREQAVRLYTPDLLWVAQAQDRRGLLRPRKHADAAVLGADDAPVLMREIGGGASELMLSDSHVVHAARPFASLASR